MSILNADVSALTVEGVAMRASLTELHKETFQIQRWRLDRDLVLQHVAYDGIRVIIDEDVVVRDANLHVFTTGLNSSKRVESLLMRCPQNVHGRRLRRTARTIYRAVNNWSTNLINRSAWTCATFGPRDAPFSATSMLQVMDRCPRWVASPTVDNKMSSLVAYGSRDTVPAVEALARLISGTKR